MKNYGIAVTQVTKRDIERSIKLSCMSSHFLISLFGFDSISYTIEGTIHLLARYDYQAPHSSVDLGSCF